MTKIIIFVLSVLITNINFFAEALGQSGIVTIASRKEAISETPSFLTKHKADKLMVRWALNDDKTTEIIGIMYIASVKCYIVGSRNLGNLGFPTENWAKNWAPQMVFYENESGGLERLNYMSSSIFRDVTTEDSNEKKAMQAYRHFLKRAKIDEKKLTRKQIVEIFIYGVAYGTLGGFNMFGWSENRTIATSDDYSDLLGKSIEAEENMSEEQKQLFDALERDNDDRWRYVIYAKTDIGYVKCSFQFKASGKLKSVKIQQRRTLLPFTI